MADYYGPEDPGRNPAFMMDMDKDCNRIMILDIDGEQADVLFDSRGPLRARTWRDRPYADHSKRRTGKSHATSLFTMAIP